MTRGMIAIGEFAEQGLATNGGMRDPADIVTPVARSSVWNV